VLELAASVAPFAIVMVHADDRTAERLRRMVVERTSATAYCPVTVLRAGRGPKWRGLWHDIGDAIALTRAEGAPQLARWLLPMADASALREQHQPAPIPEVSAQALG
jgi:hypothetical protein